MLKIKHNNKINKFPVYFFESNTTGEKKFEQFYSENDNIFLDKYKNIGFLKPKLISKEKIDKIVKSLKSDLNSRNLIKSTFVQKLKEYILDFNHIETGLNLDDKM